MYGAGLREEEGRFEEAVGGALDAAAQVEEDVGVDHRRTDVFVAEQLLDGADVVGVLEEVGGEGWRRVWQLARLVMPEQRTAADMARCTTDSCRWWRRRWSVSAWR